MYGFVFPSYVWMLSSTIVRGAIHNLFVIDLGMTDGKETLYGH